MFPFILAILLWLWAVASYGYGLLPYGTSTTANEGVIVYAGMLDDAQFNPACGYETRGTPGIFCNIH